MSIFAGVNGLLDDVPCRCPGLCERAACIETRYPQLDSIIEAREITAENQDALRQAIAEFKLTLRRK